MLTGQLGTAKSVFGSTLVFGANETDSGLVLSNTLTLSGLVIPTIESIFDPLKPLVIIDGKVQQIPDPRQIAVSGYPLITVFDNYIVKEDDYVILCGAGVTVSLLDALTMKNKILIIKNLVSSLVTVEPDGSETIDGESSVALIQYEALTLVSSGSNWFII